MIDVLWMAWGSAGVLGGIWLADRLRPRWSLNRCTLVGGISGLVAAELVMVLGFVVFSGG